MRVLQIHNHYRQAGGEDTVVRKERELLRAAGHEVVEFIAQNPNGALSATATLLFAAWNPVAARRAVDVVSENQPDVVHIHNLWWRLTPSIARSLAGVPVVMTLHNYRLVCANAKLFREGKPCEDCVGTHPWRAVRHRCYRDSALASFIAAAGIEIPRRLQAWDGVNLFLALTTFAKQRFIAGGLPPERLVVKPNFVDDPGIRANLPSESRTILYVGRLSHEKGVRTLLDAWGDSTPQNLELLIVGDGPLRVDLEASAPPGVRFVGHLAAEEVGELMLRSRALAFPSVWYEGQPMVLLEALAAGLPLIVSDLGGLPETVSDTQAAIFAQPGVRSSWARALGRLEDSQWVETAARRARSVYATRYSTESAINGLMSAYGTAMGSR